MEILKFNANKLPRAKQSLRLRLKSPRYSHPSGLTSLFSRVQFIRGQKPPVISNAKNIPSKKSIGRIIDSLNSGGVLVFPTETVYTLAVDATNAAAIDKVYKIKGRSFNKPLHVVVSSLEMASRYVRVGRRAKVLAKKFLPGPLTLILEKKNKILPDKLTSNLKTLGIRIPDLPLNLIVSQLLDKPYTTTSANISGGPNPYSIKEVLNQFNNQEKQMIDFVVDVGPLPKLKPSTLVDLTKTPYKILREGPITENQIRNTLNH